MALNGVRLGIAATASIKKAEDDHISRITPTDRKTPVPLATIQASLLQMQTDIGNAIVGEFTTNGTIPVGILVSTTGSATAQTGATTSTGTIV